MKAKLSTALLALLLAAGAFSLASCSQGSTSQADTQKADTRKAALDRAMKDGLLTQAEYDAQLQALSGAPTNAPGDAPSTVLAAPPAPEPQAAGASTGVRKEAIRDPAYNNMTAFDVNVPVNWKFQGTFIPGTSCFQSPFPCGAENFDIRPNGRWWKIGGGIRAWIGRGTTFPQNLQSIPIV